MTSSSLRRRVSALAVLATAAGLAVAPAPQAQAAEAKAATSLSIRVVQTRIDPGDSGRVRGHLAVRGDLTPAGRPVTLEARPLGTAGFTPVAATETAARGGLRVAVTPEVTTRYRWRYAGDADTRRSVSGVATIRVGTRDHAPRRLNTSLSIRKVHRVTTLGVVDLVRGRLRAGRLGLPHRPVILLARTAESDGWTFEGTHPTRRAGVVRFRVDPAENTAYRLAFLGTARLQPARSGVVRVAARPDVSIAADPQSILRGESTTISGAVTDDGTAVAGATVALWATKVGRPHSRRLVGTGTTAVDGTVQFTDSPRRSTKYRLRVAPGDGSPGALSPFVRVVVRSLPSQ